MAAEGCKTKRITTELIISDEDDDGEINALFNRVASKLGWLEEQINFQDCNRTGKKKTKTCSSRRKKKKETSKENADSNNLKVESIKKKPKSQTTKSKKKIRQNDSINCGENSVLTPLNTSKDKLDHQTDTNSIKISSIEDNNDEPNPITASTSNQKYSFLDTDSGGINYLLDQDLDDLYQDSFSPLPNVKINHSAVKSVATHLTFSCSGSPFNDDGAPSPPTVATASLHSSIKNISKEQRVSDANSVYVSEGQNIDENIFLDNNLSDSDLFDTSVTNDFKESRNEDIESAEKEYITIKSNSPVKEFLADDKFTDSPDPMNWILSPTSTNKKTNQPIIILDSDSDDDDVKEVQSLKDRLKQNWKQTSVEVTKDKKHVTKTTYRNFSAVLDSSSEDDFESFLDSIRTPSKELNFNQTDIKNDRFINDDLSSSDDDKYLHTRLLQNDKIFKSNKKTKKAFKSFNDDDDDTDDSVFKTPISIPTQKNIKSKPSISSSSTFKKPTNTSTSTSSLSNYQTNSIPISASFKTPVTKFSSTSFLRSLSTPYKGTSSPSPYVNNFKSTRDELIKKLFTLYNDTVFDNKLPSDFKITWNKRMRKTAGFCYYSQNRSKGERYSRIELSDKVCDSAERLRDTLIHELCHGAAWLVHGVSDGHGKFWKYWAAKANMAHPEIPVISRCHSYVINTKFKYDCSKCGYTIGRHSKSLDTSRYRCGCCKGEFVLRPQLDKGGKPVKKRQPSKFALYVKDNYSSVKKDNEQMKHADIMRILSQEFGNKAKISNS
ncbi:uncharacterized protein [Antedon mediterranea]|uniref:uncharacterized protein n=1 Tax=Antedon mediterranea TaxID=105859 RepID=UPI003AF99D77